MCRAVMKNRINKISGKVKKCCNYIDEQWNEFINQKYLKILFKVLPHNIFLFFLFLISIYTIALFYKSNSNNILYNQSIADSVANPIIVDAENISFENVKLYGTPTDFCLTFATYARLNNSEYKFLLYKDKKVVNEIQFNSNQLSDGRNYCFNINGIDKDNVTEYSAAIVPIYSDSNNAITFYKNAATNEPDMSFTAKQGKLSVRNLVITVFILLFLFINYLINKKKMKPEYFWLLISLVYLFAITFIIPPYQVPDEPVHFWNSYGLTQYDSSKNFYDNMQNTDLTVPENIDCINYSHIQTIDKVNDFKDVEECTKNSENKLYSYPSWWKTSNKMGYLASAAGIKLVDTVSNSPTMIFYSGRLFNLIVSIIIIFFAIKLAPKYKELILSVGTIPMFIQQMGSYSYDSLLNSLCLLAVAIIVKMIYSKKQNWLLDSIILIICGIFIVNIKIIYLPIFLLLLLIPNDKFKKKWSKYLFVIGIMLLAILCGKYIQSLFNNGAVISELSGQSTNLNMQKIFSDPLYVFPLMLNTLKVNGIFYLQSIIGYFGWFKYKLNPIFIIVYILYFGYLIKNNSKIKAKWYVNVIIIIGLLVSVAGMFASMYFYWSASNLNYIDGVQGRYFIPLLLPILLLIIPSKKTTRVFDINNCYLFINIFT